jgi:hypothetical protein
MTFDLDIPAVRACASAVSDTGARVAAGATRAPEAPGVPRWATSDALAPLAGELGRRLGALGATLGSTARQIAGAADDYEDADDRAARRLRAASWR